MLTFNLHRVLRARHIDNPYTFMVKAGISPTCATRILNSSTRVFRLKHIELLCTILLCEPSDLLLWTPEEGKVYAQNNPLTKLSQSSTDNTWQQTIATMPFRELNEVMKKIVNEDIGTK